MGFGAVLDRLSVECRARGVTLILAGGWALNHYGVSRHTADIDFLIEEEKLDEIEQILSEFGYERVYRSDLFAKYRCGTEDLLDIDVLFIEPETLAKIVRESGLTRIGDSEFRVPSLDHLIAMKLHALKSSQRHRWRKDFPDILALIDANDMDVRHEGFQSLCQRFGPEGIAEQIAEGLDHGGEGS